MTEVIKEEKSKRYRQRAYDPEVYARTKAVRLATQKAYYQSNIEERRKYQREYDTVKRRVAKQAREEAMKALAEAVKSTEAS